jgi:hypothetical protein
MASPKWVAFARQYKYVILPPHPKIQSLFHKKFVSVFFLYFDLHFYFLLQYILHCYNAGEGQSREQHRLGHRGNPVSTVAKLWGAIHQFVSIILNLRILVLLPVSTLPYVVKLRIILKLVNSNLRIDS